MHCNYHSRCANQAYKPHCTHRSSTVLLLLLSGMTMQELMKEGRKGVQEIDGTLNRAEKVVQDTLQIGQQVWLEQKGPQVSLTSSYRLLVFAEV